MFNKTDNTQLAISYNGTTILCGAAHDYIGVVLKSYEYDAFGVEKNPELLDSNPFRYCGEYWDKETDTYYLRNRDYSPVVGRFTEC